MEEKQTNELRKLQLAELKLMHAFEENGIEYYLGFGTLLSAVRHQGFIPWDDDVDIFLPRQDYDRFLQIAEEILAKPCILFRGLMEAPYYVFHFSSMEDSSFQILIHYASEDIVSNIRIDIFPSYWALASMLSQFMLFSRLHLLNKIRIFKRVSLIGFDSQKKRGVMKCTMVRFSKTMFRLGFANWISMDKISEAIESTRRRYHYERCDFVYALTYEYDLRKLICKKEWLGEGEWARFEGEPMRIPSNPHAVLKMYYGGYPFFWVFMVMAENPQSCIKKSSTGMEP